ncbi:MAG: hypothetical protein LC104_04900 [Bacteroidales bacterium]|nr:hypothetical protein [Bacteroidales bacterium]
MLDREKEKIVLAAYARAIIYRKARSIADLDGFRPSDVSDIEQDLRIALYESLDRFRPNVGEIHLFITVVVERAKARIIRHRFRGKRKATTIQTLDDLTGRRFPVAHNRDAEHSELRHDLAVVLAGLPDELRDLAERLKMQTIAEVAREKQIPRTSLMRQIKHLRRRFEKAHLRDFL